MTLPLRICFSFSLGLISVNQARASEGWPDFTRTLIRHHNETRPAGLDLISGDPFLISLYDHVSLRVRGWGGPAPGGRALNVLGASGDFRRPDGTARPLRLSYWTGPAGRPLVVYLPGSFQGSEDEDTHRMVDLLREAGNDVLVIPDPLGREYMANDPVAPPGDYDRETDVILAAIREVTAWRADPRVRLIAASHGAHLAAIVWAKDQAGDRRLFDVSLLFPQADMGEAVRLIDGHMMTPIGEDAPRALVGGIFRNALFNLVKRLQRTYLRDFAAGFRARAYPPAAAAMLSSYRRSREGRSLTFRGVLDRFVARPEVTENFSGPLARLVTWLEVGHAVNGADNVRVIVGTDDWTNLPTAWVNLPAWLDDGLRFSVVDRAGHAGLVAEDWFRRAIRAAMVNR